MFPTPKTSVTFGNIENYAGRQHIKSFDGWVILVCVNSSGKPQLL